MTDGAKEQAEMLIIKAPLQSTAQSDAQFTIVWKNLCASSDTHYFLLLTCGTSLKKQAKLTSREIKDLSKVIYRDVLKFPEERVAVAPVQQQCLAAAQSPLHTQTAPAPPQRSAVRVSVRGAATYPVRGKTNRLYLQIQVCIITKVHFLRGWFLIKQGLT